MMRTCTIAALLCAVPGAAWAQNAPGLEFDDDAHALIVHVGAETTLTIPGVAGQPTLRQALASGADDVWVIELRAIEGAAPATTLVLDTADGAPRLLERIDADDPDERSELRSEDLDGDGMPELTLVERDPGLALCGDVAPRLGLRVFDPGTREFRGARRPLSTDGAATLDALQDVVARDRTPLDGGFARSTWNGLDAVPTSPAPFGTALEDGDPATGWQLGAGVAGEWAAGSLAPGVPLEAISAVPLDGVAPPSELVLLTDAGMWRLEGDIDGPVRWELPVPVLTSCIALYVPDAGSSAVGLSELGVVTPLDGPLDTLVDAARDIAISAAVSSRTVDALSALDPGVLIAAARGAQPAPRGVLMRALVAGDADALIAEAADADWTADELAALADALQGREMGAWARTALQRHTHPGLRAAALDAIDRSPRADADAVVAMSLVELQPRAASLSQRLDAADLVNVLHAVDLSADEARAATLMSIGVGAAWYADARSDAEIDALAAAAIGHDNGSVARAGVALADVFDITDLWGELAVMAGSDPAPELRTEAVLTIASWAHRGRRTEGADDVLVSALSDDNATVRLAAARSLPHGSGPALVAASADVARDDSWPDVRAAALASLARLAPDTALDTARDLLRSCGGMTCVDVLEALGPHAGGLDSAALLDAAARQGEEPAAVFALVSAASRIDDIAPWAGEHVDDTHARALRFAAAGHVAAWDEEARAELARWLTGDDERLAISAIEAHVRWSDVAARAALIEAADMVEDPDRAEALTEAQSRLTSP